MATEGTVDRTTSPLFHVFTTRNDCGAYKFRRRSENRKICGLDLPAAQACAAQACFYLLMAVDVCREQDTCRHSVGA